MSAIAKSFTAEIIKSKNTFALWLTFIGAVIIPVTLFITYAYNWQLFIPQKGENPWNEIFIRSFNGITLFTPLFIILVIGLIFNIEHRANSWKHVFVLPIAKSNFYIGKYLFLFLLIILFFLLFSVFTWIAGLSLSLYKSELNFLSYTPEWNGIFSFLIKFFIGMLAIISIHFWFSFRIKNLIANLGIGLTGIAFAILLNGKQGNIIYFPYSFPILMLNYKPPQGYFFENYHGISFFYFMIFSGLSFLDFTKRFEG